MKLHPCVHSRGENPGYIYEHLLEILAQPLSGDTVAPEAFQKWEARDPPCPMESAPLWR